MMKITLLALTLLSSLTAFAADSIPYPFLEVQENQGNKVMVIENGVAAFETRLQMIRRAQKNIEVEYFIYNTDIAGKIITRELIAAAKRGVKVRILIDKNLATFQLNSFYAHELAQNGIEVKYYNTASALSPSTMQFRNHRKLISIDDVEAITGGRNIAEEYFDMSPEYNFNDRDIYVTGPIVKAMRDSFDLFWAHKISKNPERPARPAGEDLQASQRAWDKKVEKAKAFLEESPEETFIRSRSAQLAPSVLESYKVHDCPIATFSTDRPGANFHQRLKKDYLENYRYLRQTLAEKTLEVDRAYTLSSPYLIHNKRTRKVMEELLKKKVDIKVYTNSLGSTDAVYVAANLYLYIKAWARFGIKIFLHDGKFLHIGPAMTEEAEKARWGEHDKSQVYETSTHSEIMVGTYNLDNRSNFYNTEMALFCKGNEELSQELKTSILRRADMGLSISQDGKAVDKDGNARSIYAADKAKIVFMKFITLPSWILNFLL
jgi:putative cardiolipin synthase